MKTKLYKILAISVTVIMLVSLMVGGLAVPAGAQPPPKPLKWSNVDPGPPDDEGDWFWSGDIEYLWPMEKAIDGTYWAGTWIDSDDDDVIDAGETLLFKSTDARKWDETDYEGGEIYAIECSSTDADIVYVADVDNNLYKTSNGGDKWITKGDPDDLTGEYITAISVGYKKNGDAVFYISTSTDSFGGDVYYLDEEAISASWTAIDIEDYRDAEWLGGADVWDVEVSPDYATDKFVMAVATADIDDAGDVHTYCTYQYAGGEFGGEVDDAELLWNDDSDYDDDDELEEPLTGVYSADVWLPEGFDSDPEEDMLLFVGIASNNDDEGDVYRVISDNAWDQDVAGTGSDTNVVGLDGSGDDYMVALGNDVDDATEYVVYRTEDAGNDWDEQDEGPTGENAAWGSVVVTDDFSDNGECLFATCGTNCAVSLSRDYGETCDQISMIQANDKGGVLSYALDGDTTYLAIQSVDDTGPVSVYRDDGNWERVTMPDNNSCLLAASPDGDAVFYLDRTNFTVYRSTDGGTYFDDLDAEPDGAESIAVVSKSEFFVGGDGAVYYSKSSGRSFKEYDEGLTGNGKVIQLVLSQEYDADETLLAVTDGGKNLYKSEDAGEEWDAVKGFAKGGTVTCAAFHPDYADNGAIFAAGSLGTDLAVYRLGGPDIEEDLLDGSSVEGDYGPAYGIGLGSDGTLYVGAEDAEGVLRLLNSMGPPDSMEAPDNTDWQVMEYKFDANYLTDLTVTSGSNTVWGIADSAMGCKFKKYIDTLSGKAVLTSPADASTTEKMDRVNLAWEAMDNDRTYQYQISIDPSFKSARDTDEIDTNSVLLTGLDDGQTYYWRVRLFENKYEEMFSNWSDTWKFTTRLGAGEWNPFVGGVPEAPANGATNVPLDPTFAWNAADWATGYEFILAKDAAFTDVVVSKTGANALSTTVYLVEQPLEYSTTYYWKVRGKSNTSASEWATAVFTTIAEPGAAPTAPPTATPTPEPTTPVYIWVIIGIGAALVIAVIVLIVRTRRVA